MQESDPGQSWMITYADLMALLLCLFVLILSFADFDPKEFKKHSGPINDAFGIRITALQKSAPSAASIVLVPAERFPDHEFEKKRIIAMVREALADDTQRHVIDIVTEGRRLTMRFPGSVAFPSGSDELAPEFRPTLANIARVLQDTKGRVTVAGHTDSIPISTDRFRSNWDLSAARAVSVAHDLMEHSGIPSSRLTVSGFADSVPLVDNETSEHRSRNRRVEITLELPSES